MHFTRRQPCSPRKCWLNPIETNQRSVAAGRSNSTAQNHTADTGYRGDTDQTMFNISNTVKPVGIGPFNLTLTNPVLALVAGFLIRSFTSWPTPLAMLKIPFMWR